MQKNINKKIIFVSSVGGILEFYDFVIYLMLSPIIAHVFFNGSNFYSLLSIYIIFASGYFVRPIGGIIIGHFGDKYGRKNAFLFTIFLMSFSTLFIALLPTSGIIWLLAPVLLMIFRICQGFALGGELPASITFTFEHLPKDKRISGCAAIFAGNSFGVLLATLIITLFTNYLSHEQMLNWGWRIPFLIGAVIGAIGIYLRFSLSETPSFKELSDKNMISKIPFAELMSKFSFETVLCCIFTLSTVILFTSIFLMMPLILNTYLNYPLPEIQLYNTFFLIILLLSTIILPATIEKYKQHTMIYLIGSLFIICLLIFPVFYSANAHEVYILSITYTIISLSAGLWYGLSPYILAGSFPSIVRFSGCSVSYNLSIVLGYGLTPVIITSLMGKVQNIYCIPMFIFLSATLCILTLIILMIRHIYHKSKYD